MGTFLGYFGDPSIPEERRAEFARRVMTILDQGGMMALEPADMFGKKVWLLKTPEVQPEKKRVTFRFNYFEQDFWETGTFYPETGEFLTGKVGWRQFDRVCSAVCVLLEFYAGSFGLANVDDHLYGARPYIGWLNYLFHEQYTNDRVADPWRIYQLLPEYRQDEGILSLLTPGITVDIVGLFTYLAVAYEGDDPQWLELLEPLSHKAGMLTLPECFATAKKALTKVGAYEQYSEEQKLDLLTMGLKAGSVEGIPEDAKPFQHFAVVSCLLPVEVTAKLLADAFSLEFQELLEELRPYAKDVRAIWNPKDCPPAEPVPAFETAELVAASNDDRAWWWRPDGDVAFSQEMTEWLARCRTELEELAEQGPVLQAMETLTLLMDTLHNIQENSHYVLAFRDMFYDFLAHAEEPMVQASIRFLGRLAEGEATPERDTALRRYLAVLGNKALREKVFGF